MCGNALWCWRITSFRFTKVGHFRHNWSLTPQVGHKIFFMDHQTQSLDFCGWKFSFDVNNGFSLHYNHCLFVFCCDVTPSFHHAMLRNGRLLFVVRRLLQTVQRCVLFSRVNSGEPQIPSLHIFPHLLKMSVHDILNLYEYAINAYCLDIDPIKSHSKRHTVSAIFQVRLVGYVAIAIFNLFEPQLANM